MSIWHTDRQDPTGQVAATTALCVPEWHLAGVVRQHRLASGASRQNRLVWLAAFALAIVAHLAMTVWLMMRVAPQTGTQQPAAVSMLFEAPRTEPPQAGQAHPEPLVPPRPAAVMQDMPDMDVQSLAQDAATILPPSVQPESEHLPPVSAVPKKLAFPTMRHDREPHMSAASATDAAHTGATTATGPAQGRADKAATGGQSAAPASTAAAGQKGGFQLSCSAPEAHYPVSARHLHEEGEALAEVSINTKGQVIAARLVKSTGYDDLDDQALQTVKNLHCTPPGTAVVTGRIPVGFHIQ